MLFSNERYHLSAMISTLIDIAELLKSLLRPRTREWFRITFSLIVAWACWTYPHLVSSIISAIADERVRELQPMLQSAIQSIFHILR